jgi:pentatricopeptide repeat protein
VAVEVYRALLRTKFQPTVFTFTQLLNAFVRCGELPRARQILEEMARARVAPNEVTYTALVKGLCQEGMISDALELLDRMARAAGCRPNLRTFNTVLRGCVRANDAPSALSL